MKEKETINHITSWLSHYCDSAKMDGFIIGISGGIDSALTSTLCALTGKKTICLSMPIHQKNDQLERADEHIKWLKNKFNNVTAYTVDLSATFENIKDTFPQKTSAHFLSMANTRARLRMTTLYAIGQSENLLVTGTGNKVEDFGVGFFTKYGDGGVDISPIADLLKSEVGKLAKYLGIIDSILTAPPTDGLWETDRTDEEQLGATYKELEWAMQFSAKKQIADANLTEREKEIIAIYKKFNVANKHKMLPIPVCIIPPELKIN